MTPSILARIAGMVLSIMANMSLLSLLSYSIECKEDYAQKELPNIVNTFFFSTDSYDVRNAQDSSLGKYTRVLSMGIVTATEPALRRYG